MPASAQPLQQTSGPLVTAQGILRTASQPFRYQKTPEEGGMWHLPTCPLGSSAGVHLDVLLKVGEVLPCLLLQPKLLQEEAQTVQVACELYRLDNTVMMWNFILF